ncbi:MAG: hypothetical protein ONB31_12105 [candidate division KSB1 bacterium]|nr:hypothetical protein [candidate division KSB1 bacterium]MDZ7399678.1 hypothetical protein [candidate division KSB1 bacterium]
MQRYLSKINHKKIFDYLIQLLIVFAGVYAAFLLDDVKTQQRNQRKRIQIYQSLLKQAEQDSIEMSEAFSMLDSVVITPYLTAHEKGLMPTLKPIFLGSASYSTRTWEAILATGGLDVLDLKLIEDMEAYYLQVHNLIDRMKKMEMLCIQQLLPNFNKEKIEFYDLKTKKLNEKYKWYMQSLELIQEISKALLEENDKLLRSLRSQLK